MLPAMSASAAPILIDDFGQPSPQQFYVVSAINADPLLHKTTHASILGGERDLLVDVDGTSNLTSATGTIGGGLFDFGSSDVVTAALQYDGIDADQVVPTRALVNAGGLSVDLTGGGTNDRFRLDFANIDAGTTQTLLGVDVFLTGPGGATATFAGATLESLTPTSYTIPFSSFGTAGPFSFASVSSITLTFNSSLAPDVDFALDSFSAVPEPTGLALLAVGAGTCLRRRRR
jgi:hypothetical protein